MSTHANSNIDLKQNAGFLTIILLVTLISNFFTPLTDVAFVTAVPGFLLIFGICMAGLVLSKLAPFYLPSVAWISVVSILLTTPWTPGSEWIVGEIANVNFLAMLPPVLAYAGIAITGEEIKTFKTSGIKIAIIAMLVFTGTYIGSAIVAQTALQF